MGLLVPSCPPLQVEVGLGLLRLWISDWLGLEPVRFIGPEKALLHGQLAMAARV